MCACFTLLKSYRENPGEKIGKLESKRRRRKERNRKSEEKDVYKKKKVKFLLSVRASLPNQIS